MRSPNKNVLLIAGLVAGIVVLTLGLVWAVYTRGSASQGTTGSSSVPASFATNVSEAESTPASGELPGDALDESPVGAAGDAAQAEEQADAAAPSAASPIPTVARDFDPTPLPPETVLQHNGNGSGSTEALDLPPGAYRVFFRTDVSFDYVRPIVEEGTCGEPSFWVNLPGPFEGSTTYRSTGCHVRFEVGGSSGRWSLDIETATMRGPLTVPFTTSGDGPTTTDLLDLPEGEYRVTLKTASPYSIVTPIVVDGSCMERPIFFLAEPGEFEKTYRSGGCQVVIEISDVTADWELAILQGE